jgi:tetraacyldisaccharide 4'-kinase
VSAPDRVAGARAALQAGARLVIIDDGFQHRRLHRDLDIVCIDARWPGGEGPLPVGTRREPWSGLDRADWVWHHHAPDLHPTPLTDRGAPARSAHPTVRSRVVLQPIRPAEGPRDVALGLARPEGALCSLLRAGVTVRSVVIVRDHGDLPDLKPATLVTEKDAARLPKDATVDVIVMDLEVAGAQPLLDQIVALVAP